MKPCVGPGLAILVLAAAMTAMLACGPTLREAMPIANRAGGIVVGKFGTAGVTYEELFA